MPDPNVDDLDPQQLIEAGLALPASAVRTRIARPEEERRPVADADDINYVEPGREYGR